MSKREFIQDYASMRALKRFMGCISHDDINRITERNLPMFTETDAEFLGYLLPEFYDYLDAKLKNWNNDNHPFQAEQELKKIIITTSILINQHGDTPTYEANIHFKNNLTVDEKKTIIDYLNYLTT